MFIINIILALRHYFTISTSSPQYSTHPHSDIAVGGNHLTAMTGHHMPYRITQFYLSPAALTFPPLPQPKLVLGLVHGGMQGWVALGVQLDINSYTRTRAHTKKSVVRRCRYDVRKYSFSNRITNIWNSLPDEIISAPTVNTFKNRLDRFWAEQEVLYNYKANITGNKGVNS